MDVKKVKGTAIVSIAGGEKLGSVEDVIIDSQERRVAALKIQSGGLIRKDHHYLPFGAIQTIGGDAVMIQNDTVLQQSYGERPSGYHNLGNITGLRVVTDTGTYIGNINSIHFDPQNGAITEYEVGTGGLFRSNTLIDAGTITSIGTDIMVVPAAAVGEQTSS